MQNILIKYEQSDSLFYSGVFAFKDIHPHALVLEYGDPEAKGYGYQRAVNKYRVNRITKSLLEGNLVSPTSITIGCETNEFQKLIKSENNILQIHFNNIKKYKKLFRIIDGQHRLKAIEKAINDGNKKYENYMINVIFVMIDDNNRIKEVELFNDINSKGVGVKTDYAILARHNYFLLEDIESYDLNEHVCIEALRLLNDDRSSVWYNGIKFDINNKPSPGIIGLKSFFDSLLPIVKKYITEDDHLKFDKIEDKYKKIQYTENLAKMLYKELLEKQWKIVYLKWKDCFLEEHMYEDLGRYKKDYYIQKTIGTKAINSLLLDGKGKINIDNFQDIILNSKLSSSNWKKGDIFTGVSSFSGAKVISERIKNI